VHRTDHTRRGGPRRFVATALSLCLIALAATAYAATLGRIKGRIVGTDTNEPIGFADVALVPNDSTMHPVGGLSNADGTFQLDAPAGSYTLKIRAISYATKRIEGVVLAPGGLVELNTALTSEAIRQQEVVVEAKALLNSETSLLNARKKAPAVGDAVSAEQIRRAPDRDAAEVLRRVTGLAVNDGKYVYVRGLGERYSSTEVDGVRIATPEQNKRVVPLDLFPSALLENIVVQKTYTADRPGEFGGGDVQVHTRDFPGRRTWQLSTAQGANDGTTFDRYLGYESSRSDLFGFGADSRRLPSAITGATGGGRLPADASTQPQLGRSFADVWSPRSTRALPNGTYTAMYGDEFRVLGRSLGVVAGANYARSFDRQSESQRLFQSRTDTLYDYSVDRSTESAQLAGNSGISYRLSPSHTLHVRGLYTNDADDEVRVYEGPDHNRDESQTGTFLHHRDTRLQYVQRNVMSLTAGGEHEFPHTLGSSFDWKFSRSRSRRQQPDMRETVYDRRYYPINGELTPFWILGSAGLREFGDMQEDGWGTVLDASVPYRLGPLGKGMVRVGFDRQTKARESTYRRFTLNVPRQGGVNTTAPPEVIFAPGNFKGGTQDTSEYVLETTTPFDNYRATQRTEAGYISSDVPLGQRLRGNVGVRFESGRQEIRSYDVVDPATVTQRGENDSKDWLPCANVTWLATSAINVRLGASRTLSRPDLTEMSTRPTLEYVGGFVLVGNPNLRRARIDNYDVRVEAFPGAGEVLAAGVFDKELHDPIEQVIRPGAPDLLMPMNSADGHNRGVELEARARLERLWGRLKGLSINTNASFVSSAVHLPPLTTRLGSQEHPLQGQANYTFNASMTYGATGGRLEASVLVGSTGKRLTTLATGLLHDVYEQPFTSLDATAGVVVLHAVRIKCSAKNLLDPRVRQLQDGVEYSGYRKGRGYSVAVSYGS